MFRKWKELNSVDVSMHNPEATWDSLHSATLTTPYVTSHTLVRENRGADCSFALHVKMRRGVEGGTLFVSRLLCARFKVFRVVFLRVRGFCDAIRWRLKNDSAIAETGVPGGAVVSATALRRFAGSIPDVVIRIFHWHNPSGRPMALESTQPLTEMSTRNISCG